MTASRGPKHHEEFFRELRLLMISQGIRSIRWLDVSLTETGNIVHGKDHVIAKEDATISKRSYLQYGEYADQILRESIINRALDTRDEELFKFGMGGDIYVPDTDGA